MLACALLLTACEHSASPAVSAPSPHGSRTTHTPKPKPTRTPAPLVPLHRFDPADHPAIAHALAFIQGKVDVPVVLPPYLPTGLHLAQDHPVYRIGTRRPGWMLALDWPRHGEFLFQYGASAFDGCGGESARPIEIRGQPGLVLTIGHDEAAEVIWPATPDHQTGRYGIQGNLPTRQVMRLAQWMPVLSDKGTDSSC
jgi:hypothetical protein